MCAGWTLQLAVQLRFLRTGIHVVVFIPPVKLNAWLYQDHGLYRSKCEIGGTILQTNESAWAYTRVLFFMDSCRV